MTVMGKSATVRCEPRDKCSKRTGRGGGEPCGELGVAGQRGGLETHEVIGAIAIGGSLQLLHRL